MTTEAHRRIRSSVADRAYADDNERVHFSPVDLIRAVALRVFADERERLLGLVPDADVQHVGGTAVPDCLTKGDLDIQVRVDSQVFTEAQALLASAYVRKTRPHPHHAAFALFGGQLPVDVHLTRIDGPGDIHWRFRDVLLQRPDFRQRYDDLKRRFEGRRMQDYRRAKNRIFVDLRLTVQYQQLRTAQP